MRYPFHILNVWNDFTWGKSFTTFPLAFWIAFKWEAMLDLYTFDARSPNQPNRLENQQMRSAGKTWLKPERKWEFIAPYSHSNLVNIIIYAFHGLWKHIRLAAVSVLPENLLVSRLVFDLIVLCLDYYLSFLYLNIRPVVVSLQIRCAESEVCEPTIGRWEFNTEAEEMRTSAGQYLAKGLTTSANKLLT